jgi:excisionase family DNA binding protein
MKEVTKMENNQQVDLPENLPQALLDVEEVAHILHISRSNCYLLIQEGFIPSIHIGRSRRVRPVDLEQFISSNRFGENIR